MTANASRMSQEGVSLLLAENDFLNFSETTDSLYKKLDAIREVIECKTNIFLQKKEKHQQILDVQMMKLDNERKEYIKKSETVMNEMGEAKSKLMQIEHSYFNLKNKLNLEKQTNKTLKDRICQLQSDNKQKNAKFYKTSELYSTVISWYNDYLNMSIEFDKGNRKNVTVTFKESKKDFKGYPYVKLEILSNNKFKILKMYPSMEEDKENNLMKEILMGHEIILFLHKFRRQFLSMS